MDRSNYCFGRSPMHQKSLLRYNLREAGRRANREFAVT